MKPGRLTTASGVMSVLLSACSGSEPCHWTPEVTDKVHLGAPGSSLSCNGTVEDITDDLVAFYGNSVFHGASSEPVLDVWIQTGTLRHRFSIAGNAPNGAYSLPDDGGFVATQNGVDGATGVFAFERSHDVPFVDIDDPEADEVYQSVIDVDLDLVITKFAWVDSEGRFPMGCTLTTGRQQARLMQKGRITTCRGASLNGKSHPG
jgi:hypothetical protein